MDTLDKSDLMAELHRIRRSVESLSRKKKLKHSALHRRATIARYELSRAILISTCIDVEIAGEIPGADYSKLVKQLKVAFCDYEGQIQEYLGLNY